MAVVNTQWAKMASSKEGTHSFYEWKKGINVAQILRTAPLNWKKKDEIVISQLHLQRNASMLSSDHSEWDFLPGDKAIPAFSIWLTVKPINFQLGI